MFEPCVQRSEAESPALPHLESRDLSVPRHPLQRLPVHPQDRSGFLQIQQPLERLSRCHFTWLFYGQHIGTSQTTDRSSDILKIGAENRASHCKIRGVCAGSAHRSSMQTIHAESAVDRFSCSEHSQIVVFAESGTRSGFYRRPAATAGSAFLNVTKKAPLALEA